MEQLSIAEPVEVAAHGERYVLGILGGMGPLASAEFVKTIYECSMGEVEQHSPMVLMYSDPAFPDRTETLIGGSYDELLSRLTRSLEALCSLNVSQIVICCVTAHYLLPELAPHLRAKVASLLDPIFEQARDAGGRHLLLCSTGARRLGLFERHAEWERTREHILLPDERDQQVIHDLIYRIKVNDDAPPMFDALEALLERYGVNSFIAGCTEIHVLAKQFMTAGDRPARYQCIDPLSIIARRLIGRRV